MATRQTRTTFDVKSANLPLISFILKSANLETLASELTSQYSSQPDYFDNDLAVIDLSELAAENPPIDFAVLLKLLKSLRIQPFSVRGGSDEQMQAALAAGLLHAPDITPMAPRTEHTMQEIIKEVPVSVGTLVIDKPLRSGQQIYARGADLIVTSLVSFGAEIIADGNVHVYAPLRGRVIAGAQGNTDARIYATCFEPELLSIAGIYQTTEKALPKDIFGKPTMVQLQGESLVMTPIQISHR